MCCVLDTPHLAHTLTAPRTTWHPLPCWSTAYTPNMPNGTLPWVSNTVAQHILTYLQIAYPIILICLYIITFTVRSISTARNEDETAAASEQLGPGGKPLPQQNKKEPGIHNALDFSKPRKLLFEWLSLGVIGTIAGNITVVIVHTVFEREEHWWCGQAPTVCARSCKMRQRQADSRRYI